MTRLQEDDFKVLCMCLMALVLISIASIAVTTELTIRMDCDDVSSLPHDDAYADEGEYPWHVGIMDLSEGNPVVGPNVVPVCGGTLVLSQWVMTGAACFHHFMRHVDPSDLSTNAKVLLGAYDLSDANATAATAIQMDIDSVLIHPGYEVGVVNDLALVKLSSSVDFAANPHIKTARLPSTSVTMCVKLKSIDWGKYNWQGQNASKPKEIDIILNPRPFCQIQLNRVKPDSVFGERTTLCSKGSGPCQVHYGGSLTQWNEYRQATLIGINSWGLDCSNPDEGTRTYTDVFGLRSWWYPILFEDSAYN